MIKKSSWAGFSRVNTTKSRMGREGAGDGFGGCCGFARPTLVQRVDWFSGCDHWLTHFAVPQPWCKNPSNDIVLSLVVFHSIISKRVRAKIMEIWNSQRPSKGIRVHVYWNGRWNWSSFTRNQQTQEILELLPKNRGKTKVAVTFVTNERQPTSVPCYRSPTDVISLEYK